MTTFDELAEELVVQWINGNRANVVAVIQLQPHAKAVTLVAKIMAKFSSKINQDDLANLLQTRCEEGCGVCGFS